MKSESSRPLRIWEIISGPQLNGAVLQAKWVAEELASRGHEVTVVGRTGSWLLDQEWPGNVRLIASDMDRWPLSRPLAMARQAKAEGVDVFHSHMTRADNYGLALRAFTGIPSVCTAQAHTRHPHWFLHDHVIAVSDSTREFHRRTNWVPNQRMTTIHNLVAPSRYPLEALSRRDALRAEFGAAPGDLVFGVLAHIHPRKGQDLLVETMPALRAATGGKFRVVLAGEESPVSFSNTLRSRAAQLGVAEHLQFAGVRTDIADTLAAFDIACLSSRAEAFSVALLEAMMMQRPYVATLVGGATEFTPPDGPAGWLVPPDNVERLTGALLEAIGTPAAERVAMGERGRAFVLSRYTAEIAVPRIEGVLWDVVAAHTRR
jgi:glycosyltransferase involved in cell wall biosynthesis